MLLPERIDYSLVSRMAGAAHRRDLWEVTMRARMLELGADDRMAFVRERRKRVQALGDERSLLQGARDFVLDIPSLQRKPIPEEAAGPLGLPI